MNGYVKGGNACPDVSALCDRVEALEAELEATRDELIDLRAQAVSGVMLERDVVDLSEAIARINHVLTVSNRG